MRFTSSFIVPTTRFLNYAACDIGLKPVIVLAGVAAGPNWFLVFIHTAVTHTFVPGAVASEIGLEKFARLSCLPTSMPATSSGGSSPMYEKTVVLDPRRSMALALPHHESANFTSAPTTDSTSSPGETLGMGTGTGCALTLMPSSIFCSSLTSGWPLMMSINCLAAILSVFF